MLKFFFLVFTLCVGLFAQIITIATYNVENLFDITNKKDFRYKEYIPNTKSLWNKKSYNAKLQNISKVIKDMDAEIVALQEIGSKQALKDLQKQLRKMGANYNYIAIANKKPTAVKVALLSKLPFVYTKELHVTYLYKYRNILEVKYKIKDKELYLFINHWKSKASPESARIIFAKTLLKRISKIGYDKNIIILGDFNSDYEEYKKFKRKRKLNDTHGKTAINHILKTIKQQTTASKVKYEKYAFYNLWYDADKNERYTYIFRGKKEALDSIIVSQSLLQKNGISYIHRSIKSFKKPYLFKGKYIYRWQISRGKIKKHKAKGYSDHLAVMAKFRI